MRMLLTATLATFLLATSGSFASQWEYGESKDALTGEVSQRYLFARSILPLQTAIGLDTYPALGLTCGDDAPYLRSDDIAIDADVDCSEYGCSSRQWVRLKFDEDKPVSLKGDVWEERNGISLYAGNENLIARMKKGNTLILEFKPVLGYEKRLAMFSLVGFSKAYSKCPSQPKKKPDVAPKSKEMTVFEQTQECLKGPDDQLKECMDKAYNTLLEQ